MSQLLKELYNLLKDSRVGIPIDILIDKGSNFMSQLLKELYYLLKVNAVRTRPYHVLTDRLEEQFNQTLKTMMKTFATFEGKFQ